MQNTDTRSVPRVNSTRIHDSVLHTCIDQPAPGVAETSVASAAPSSNTARPPSVSYALTFPEEEEEEEEEGEEGDGPGERGVVRAEDGDADALGGAAFAREGRGDPEGRGADGRAADGAPWAVAPTTGSARGGSYAVLAITVCTPHHDSVTAAPVASSHAGTCTSPLRITPILPHRSHRSAPVVHSRGVVHRPAPGAGAWRTVRRMASVLTKVDFDVEGGALPNTAANTRRAQAIAKLQAQHPGLDVSFTLPVMPEGLTQDGVNLLSDAKADGVGIGTVNVMAMDYGSSYSGDTGGYAEQAATATQAQVKSVLGLSDADAWKTVAVTPVIGVNDVSSEVFTVDDATRLAGFATSKGLGGLSMWSAARDQQCPGGPKPSADPTCSSVAQDTYAFSKAFAAFG